MTIKASKESLKRAEIDRNKWKRSDQRPKSETDEFSVDVLMYDPEDDLHSLGWFNFDTDKWSSHIEFHFNEGWVWCYPPKPHQSIEDILKNKKNRFEMNKRVKP